MRVSDILDQKGLDGATVFSIDADADIETAARELVARRIGAVVVRDPDGWLQGILTERDVLNAVAMFGEQAARQTVASFMTENLITCTPDQGLDELFRVMIDNSIRHLPVLDDGRLVGLLSIRDLSRAVVSAAESENRDLRNLVRHFSVKAG